MVDRTHHQEEVQAFLNREFNIRDWEFSLPHSWGKESYYARSKCSSYFIKLEAPLANYLTMSSLGFTPPVIASGFLDDGTSILVQPVIQANNPSRGDFRVYLEKIASLVGTMQRSAELRQPLPQPPSEQYRDLGLRDLTLLRQRWERYKPQVPQVARWVDESLDQLTIKINAMDGQGVVVTHHDICNANWLISKDGQIYLIDLDDLALDDPAVDLGALLWWYYPPELRGRFLEIAGYGKDSTIRQRMLLRMTLHCLRILLPREGSFDRFDGENFALNLADFRAILAGEENPQGYG